MRVLVACEYSGAVREAFRALGHDAWSCDLLPGDDASPFHIQGDVLPLLTQGWDLMIAHPPCTYLSVSGMHWTTRGLRDPQLTEDALDFVRRLMDAPIERIAVENPVSVISSRIRKPDQIIQPWWFGDDASKKTCLWLKGLPLLRATNRLPGDDKTRRANQTPSGQNKLGPRGPVERAQQDLSGDCGGICRTVGGAGMGLITAEQARELFGYDPETGVLVWKKPPIRQNSRVGTLAGSKRQRGREVGADGRSYLVHRIVWLWVYGAWPEGSIDHINGDAGDNRISNLRDVSHQVNMQNQRGLSKNNTTGFKGVTMSRGKFRAQISVGGRQRNLGRYSTPEEAHAAYLKAKRELHEGCTI